MPIANLLLPPHGVAHGARPDKIDARRGDAAPPCAGGNRGPPLPRPPFRVLVRRPAGSPWETWHDDAPHRPPRSGSLGSIAAPVAARAVAGDGRGSPRPRRRSPRPACASRSPDLFV